VLYKYEALGRTHYQEYEEGVKIMEKFIGRKGVFLPKLIIVDENGKHIETTNRTKLPGLTKRKKSMFLDYEPFDKDMPLTNPNDMGEALEKRFRKSKYAK